MPPTAMFVCLRDTHVINGWTTERLPRGLRYLELRGLEIHRTTLRDRKIDLRRLPTKMQELFVIGGWYSGQVCLENLPQSMRITRLANAVITEAFIAHERLPVGIEGVSITRNLGANERAAPVRLRPIGGVRKDARVVNHGERFKSKYSIIFANE